MNWYVEYMIKGTHVEILDIKYDTPDNIFHQHFEGKDWIVRPAGDNARYSSGTRSKKEHFKSFNDTNMTSRIKITRSELPQGTLTEKTFYRHIKDLNIWYDDLLKEKQRSRDIDFYQLDPESLSQFVSDIRTKSREILLNNILE